MIKDGKMYLDLPEDWKKIIRILKEGATSRKEVVKRSGIEESKVSSILRAMENLGMIEKGHNWKVKWRDKK